MVTQIGAIGAAVGYTWWPAWHDELGPKPGAYDYVSVGTARPLQLPLIWASMEEQIMAAHINTTGLIPVIFTHLNLRCDWCKIRAAKEQRFRDGQWVDIWAVSCGTGQMGRAHWDRPLQAAGQMRL